MTGVDAIAFDGASESPDSCCGSSRTETGTQDATTPRRSHRKNQMTAIADTGPGQLIRWHHLGYAVVALGVMTVAQGTMQVLTIVIMARFVTGL